MKRLIPLTVAALLVATTGFAQTWQLDPAHSRAQFTARHMMMSNVRGDFSGIKGTVEYDGKDMTKAKINAVIDVNSMTTRVDKRDAHLKSEDFFDAANHPTMTFVSTSIAPKGAGKFSMTGDLTIRGITKRVTFDLERSEPYTDQKAGIVRLGAAASATVNRKDFGMKWNQVLDNGGLVVADDILIQLDIEMTRRIAPATN